MSAQPSVGVECLPERLRAGIGLRQPHYEAVIEDRPALRWRSCRPRAIATR
jgi:hypothetical protein